MSAAEERAILTCWHESAAAWTKVVREKQIASRHLATDAAIVNAVLATKPQTVLDIGCGEGWLARDLNQCDIDVLGIDVVPELIADAQAMGVGRFNVVSYQELEAGALVEQFDAAVCNFSLLGESSVEAVFKAVPKLLKPNGYFIVQTLHPEASTESKKPGWRQGSWQGIDGDFATPAPWYFRNIDDWLALFHTALFGNGFSYPHITEVRLPDSEQKCSVIFSAQRASR